MLSRTQIRQFLAVVDSGSFTRAANALNIAQPSLSGGIAELERQLGTRLFVRERRRISLTEAGNLLLPLARSIEREFDQVAARIGNRPVPRRPVRLGVLDTVSTGWIADAVRAYQGEDPLELTEGNERELHSALGSGSIDLALTILPRERRGVMEELLRDDYCLALPAGHSLAGRAVVEASDVAGETMIARRACEVLAETSRFFTERGVRPRFALRSANDDRALQLVAAGLGVTVAPRSLGRDGLAMVKLADFNLARTLGLIFAEHWTPQAAAHPLVLALRAAVWI